jgi:branched-subunit amino acid aminotransferase/4-amino-4-deoxychorismate lyase
VETRAVSLDEIKNAAEVFMTSTTKRILPVTQVDDTLIGHGKAGPVSTLLNEAFIRMEDQFIASYRQPLLK